MSPRILPLGRADRDAVLDLLGWAFGMTVLGPATRLSPDVIPWDRLIGARLGDPDRLSGILATYHLDLPVPGAQLPAAGLTWAAVHPRDRRRGVLTAMVRHHLREVRDRGVEPVAVLFASEATIYGRFGFGRAAHHLRLTLPRRAPLRQPCSGSGGPSAGSVPGGPGSAAAAWDGSGLRVLLETAEVRRHAGPLTACYDRVRRDRPGNAGLVSPGISRMSLMALADPPASRPAGREPLRVLSAVDADGAVRGYALFWRRGRDSIMGPPGTVEVTELTAEDAVTSQALWERLLDLDLTCGVVSPRLAVDDPLLHLLLDPAAVSHRNEDNLWCRLVDVPAALAGRRYQAPADVVLEVTDAWCPWNAGRWHLVAGPDRASCRPTDAEPQVRLDVRELGAVYLGGVSLRALADAGLVGVDDPRALVSLAVALGWPRAPMCPWEI